MQTYEDLRSQLNISVSLDLTVQVSQFHLFLGSPVTFPPDHTVHISNSM
jgi:hypothetical protein